MINRTNLAAAILVTALVLVTGLVRHYSRPQPVTRLQHQQAMQQREVRQRFEQAVVMLHAKQYDNAVTALHRVLELAPRMPEAHANMGYALMGLDQPGAAHAFFATATALNPRQANAYYGLALVHEHQGDLHGALGNMRTYLHFSPAEDPHRARARAAIWEWEKKLGRIPDPAAQAGPPGAAASAGAPARR